MAVKKYKNGWGFRFYTPPDPKTGQRRRIQQTGFKTKREAKDALQKIQDDSLNGVVEEKKNIPLFQDYILEWCDSVYKGSVEITSYGKVRSIICSQLIPHFGEMHLDEIKPYDIDMFYAKKLKDGLSPAYIQNIHTALSLSLKKAIDWELIAVNPIQNVKPPSIQRKNKQTWTVEEIRQFIKICEEDVRGFPFILAIFTGLRRGEVLGLRWRHVDFERGILFIRDNLVALNEGKTMVKSLKTKSSLRNVYISTFLVDKLNEYYSHQKSTGFGSMDDFIFCTKVGTPLHPRNLNRTFMRLIKIAHVPKISFHALRHTHATIMMMNGENPKTVSERLGHSRVSVTLDFYSHVSPELQQNAAARFEQNLLEK